MIPFVLLSFIVMFALVALTVGVGMKYLENRKKKKVATMLRSAVSSEPEAETKILIDPGKEGSSPFSRYLEQFNFGKRVEEQIQQAGLTMSLNTLLLQTLVLGAFGAVIGGRFRILMFPAPSALLGALVGGLLPYLFVRRKRKKRLGAFEEQFPDALDFLARAMRAGHAFSIALEMLSEESPQPLGQEFRKVFNETNLGLPIETAMGNLTTRVPLLDVRFFVSAVLLQRETGGNLSEILTQLSHVIRERFKLKGQVRAASAHGRITGAILSLMPVALVFGLLLVAPGYMQSMVNDKDGQYLIAGVIVCQILGHLCIKKIINIKV